MPVSEQTYLQLALEDIEGQWELHCGRLVGKPVMSYEHDDLAMELGYQFMRQLSRDDFRVRVNMGRVRRSSESYYLPDVYVIPIEQTRSQRGTRRLEVYASPLPLVVEIWSRSTGDYDVEAKLPEYQRRGDLEIWRIHPYNRTLTAWRRQPDGSYTETVFTEGVISPVALPNVAIEFDALFDFGEA